MPPRREHIDRRLTLPPVEPPGDLVARFLDEHGEPADSYDLSQLNFPLAVAPWLTMAFRGRHVASASRTRRANFRSLRTFSRFLREDGQVVCLTDLDTAAINRFLVWLQSLRRQGKEVLRSPSSLTHTFSTVRALLTWLHRRRPDCLPRISFPSNPFPLHSEWVEPYPGLSDAGLKAVLEACYAEIDDIWACFEQGQRMLAGDNSDPDLAELVRAMHKAGGGVALSSKALNASGIKLSRFTEFGGLRVVTQYLHLTYDTFIPFYVAIAIQTAANPEPLRLIRRDCLVPHPLDEQREFVDWVKPRAGGRFRRPQRRSFDLRRPYAAPHLIRKVLAMTEPLVPRAGRTRDRLFLIQNEKSRAIDVANQQSLGDLIDRFVRRSNALVRLHNRTYPTKPRQLVPRFAPITLRSSVARSHYQASGGDIVAVQGVLNHASLSTTETYVAGESATRMREEVIARAQRFMVTWVSGPQTLEAVGDADANPRGPAYPARGFAHDCLDPLGGSGPGAEPGRACPHLGGCLTCPGLVILLDVDHLARLLALRAALEAARERLDPPRWNALYSTSHRILVEQILPEFPVDLTSDAIALAASWAPLPDLE